MDSDFYDDETDDEVTDTPPANDPSPKALRRAADEGKKAKAELAAAKRELAMLKAGVDTESPIGKLFTKAYEGDIDSEAIKAEWAVLAPTAPADTPSTPEVQISADEANSTNERANLANNSPADEAPKVDPRKAAFEAGLAARAQGATSDEAIAVHFDNLVASAIKDPNSPVVIKAFQS